MVGCLREAEQQQRCAALPPSFLLATTGGALVPCTGLALGRLGLSLATLLERIKKKKQQAEI